MVIITKEIGKYYFENIYFCQQITKYRFSSILTNIDMQALLAAILLYKIGMISKMES